MPRTYPPYDFGNRTLSETLSSLASSTPDRIYASIPRTNDVADGFLDISVSDMERMVVYLASWLESTWGRSSNFETIAYIGIPDLRSVVLFFAVIRNGYKTFFPSPRNAMEATVSLLEQTACSKIIYAKEVTHIIDQLCALRPTSAIAISSFEEIYQTKSTCAISPAKRPFEEVKNDPILILHSSGSTGFPKPITMTNGSFAVLDSERFLPRVPGRTNRDFSIWDFEGGGKFFTVFPYFHLAGFLSLVVNPVFTEASSPVIGPPLALLSGGLMRDVLRMQDVRAIYVPPSIAEQMLAEPDGIESFKQLDFVCYTGGPFSPTTGAELVQVTELVPLYGSTEAFQTPQLVPSKEDWAYMEWNPNFKHRMDSAEDGAYELVLFADSSTEKSSALNHNLPGTSEWRTRDLFMPHPSKPNLWQYYGRRDDIVVFSNGEKFNPLPVEQFLAGGSVLSGVLVVGQGRVQASLLLEPKSGCGHDDKALIDDIWPLVEQANSLVPAHGRISRSKILVVAPSTFVRAGKGTVIRKLSEKKLQAEVDTLYGKETSRVFLTNKFEKSAVEVFVRDIVTDAFTNTIGVDDDFFELGIDSLKTTEIIRNLRTGPKPICLSGDLDWISMDLVYRYPSISQLSEAMFQNFAGGKTPPDQRDGLHAHIAAAIAEHTENFPKPSPYIENDSNEVLTIALTGSTGSLGTALLRKLIQDSRNLKIYCLNRRVDQEHEAEFANQVQFFKVQFHEKDLGLEYEDYQTLLSNVDIIIHNAWRLNFSLPLKAFQKQLRGLRNLINWSLQSPRHPRLVFCSSVSSVMNWPLSNLNQPIPESLISTPESCLGTGYSASKFVAEQMLGAASIEAGLDVVILRLGQIVQSGDFSLDSTRLDRAWIPGLFETSKALGGFPRDICNIDWLTLDEAAAVVLELSTQSLSTSNVSEGQLLVYNVVNQSTCSWEDVLPRLCEAGITPNVPVTLAEWRTKLRNAISSGENNRTSLPSSQIMPLFDALGDGKQGLRYETQGAKSASPTLGSALPVDREKVLSWIKL